jgi:hypothetical protein
MLTLQTESEFRIVQTETGTQVPNQSLHRNVDFHKSRSS